MEPQHQHEGDEPRSASPASMYAYAGLGMELVGGIAGFLLLGYWLDRRLGGGSTWTTTGAIVGCVGGLYHLIRKAIAMQRAAERRARGNRTDRKDD